MAAKRNKTPAKAAAKKSPAKASAAKAGKKTAAKPTPKKAAAKTAAKPTPKKAAAKTAAKPTPKKAAAKTAAKPTPKKAAAKPTPKKAAAKTAAKPKAKKAAVKTAAKPKAKKAAVKSVAKQARKTPPGSVAKATKTSAVESAAPAKRKDSYMNEKQKAHFRERLLVWKRQLMEEVDRTVSHMKDEAANYPDPADRASQEEEFSLELRTRDRERKLINKIDSTLELLDLDEYGYCESCGIEIGLQRLEARPTATQCIDCKTLDEIKERQTRG